MANTAFPEETSTVVEDLSGLIRSYATRNACLNGSGSEVAVVYNRWSSLLHRSLHTVFTVAVLDLVLRSSFFPWSD